MTQVPALREALQEAAHRRYGRRRWGRFFVAVPVAAGCALAVWIVLSSSSSPERETVATPSPTPAVHTLRVTTLPTPAPITGPPLLMRARVLDDAEAVFLAEGGSSKARLERAWATPGMQGEDAHVFLYRRGAQRCLSVPDPLATQPGDRGVSCSPPEVFERFGVSVTVGSNYAAVVPDPKRRPLYRHADGTREPLEPIDGLVAIARAEPGSAVALYAPDGKRRTDAFRDEQRGSMTPNNRYECSNGESVIVPSTVKLDEDPCAAMDRSRPRRGG